MTLTIMRVIVCGTRESSRSTAKRTARVSAPSAESAPELVCGIIDADDDSAPNLVPAADEALARHQESASRLSYGAYSHTLAYWCYHTHCALICASAVLDDDAGPFAANAYGPFVRRAAKFVFSIL